MYVIECVIHAALVKKRLDRYIFMSKDPECMSAWSAGLEGASHTLLEKEQDPRYALHCHSMLCILASWLGTFLWVDDFV